MCILGKITRTTNVENVTHLQPYGGGRTLLG